MSSFRYKDVDLLSGNNSLQLSLAVAGIGLPEDTFLKFSKIVQKMNKDIVCIESYGEMCYADVGCSELASSIRGSSFDFGFSSAADRLVLPIEALLKESTKRNQCKLLVTNLGINSQSNSIVLGTAFF